jgi:predicted AlkP superfamily phosphohydrolase/phosphomutase
MARGLTMRWRDIFALLLMGAAGIALYGCADDAKLKHGRTVVLGFDGLDPELVEAWMADGTLPRFAALKARGSYQRLGTTNPPQSPVAWASFVTGGNPGEHGIFDFLTRDAATHQPDLSIAKVTPPQHHLDLFGYRLALDAARIENRRVGKPFWTEAEEHGERASVLQVPVTFPPDKIHRMLSGMGVPDLLGTQGTYTLYTAEARAAASGEARVVQVAAAGSHVATQFDGPRNPLTQAGAVLSMPLTIDATVQGARVRLGDQTIELTVGQWSSWAPIRFSAAPFAAIRGIVRLHLVQGFPSLRLYVSPINFDPRDPAMPISSPPDYARELSERIGLFHTLGMAEETWSLNNGDLTDDAYLDMIKTVLAEREAMLFDTLARRDSELVVMVFVQTDRVSHMFWRGIDPQHPQYARTTARGRDAIRWIYREADRILGRTLDALSPNDRLIVLSDHGFAPFRRAVNVNRWLVDNGYLVLRPGRTASAPLFAQVDWARTRAYALGLNGIYLNLAGRENQGVVPSAQAAALKREIRERLATLADPDSATPAITHVYDAADIYHGPEIRSAPDLVVGYARGYRASWQTALGGAPEPLFENNGQAWSGDHCIDPTWVPGVLFTSFPLAQPVVSIADAARLALGTNSSARQ